MKNEKGFIQIIIILVVVALVAGFVLLKNGSLNSTIKIGSPVPSATPDPTIGWKTYSYPNYNYSFKVPSTYIVGVNNHSPKETWILQSQNFSETGASGGKNDLIITVSSQILPAVLETNGVLSNFSKKGTKIINDREWTITSNSTGDESLYVIQVGNTSYMVDGRNTNFIEQVISTFQFTTQNQTDTSNWKTYTLQVAPIALSVNLPPQILFSDGITPGQTGTKYRVPDNNNLTASNDLLLFSADSVDYSAGRSAIFSDIQGYFIKDGNYYINWALSQNKSPIVVPSDLSPKEIINTNGVHILKLKNPTPNETNRSDGFLFMPTDLGAIINTNSKNYPGITFQVNSSALDENTFDQILNSFKFTQ